MQNAQELLVQVHAEDGGYWATVDQFPGVFAAGDTIDELRESLEEGIALYLENPERGRPEVSLSEFRPDMRVQTSAELICA